MCVALGALSGFQTATLALTAASVGVSAYGQYQQVKAQNAAAEYNAQILNQNAKFAELEAKDAEKRGEIEEKQHRLRVSRAIGDKRAQFGASGAVVDEGTPLDVIDDTITFGELDALTIKHNTATEANRFRRQGFNFNAQSQLSRASQTSPGFAAGSTLLTGTSRLFETASNFNN